MAENDDALMKPAVSDELEPEQKRKVFIGSLSYRIEESVFREYWTQFGTVLDAMILRDRDGRSRGFGFVTFENSSSVDEVMKSRPHTLDNRVVEPKRAVPREESHKPDMQMSVKKLYLGGVKEPLTEDDLKEYFSKYGAVTNAIVMKDREGQYRGFGFIEFDDYDPVDRIILEKNHMICGRSIDVQKAQTREAVQRSNGNMRGRPGPPFMSSRPDYNSGYDNYQQQQQDNYSTPYGMMPNNSYNGYSSDFNGGSGAPFGQGYGQESFGGPMRRGNGDRGYAPYQNRGRGGRGGGSNNQESSWTSWE